MKIQELLLKKASEDKLGHFYIVETSDQQNASKTLMEFVHEFIRNYYQKVEGSKLSMVHLMDHPDVFVLGNPDEEDDKFFKVEEAETLPRFFDYKAVQSKRKFAVITSAHRINNVVANKWLKLLEEPTGNATIFLLNPRGQQLLPTIHSRAIHLRLPGTTAEAELSHWNEFLSDAKQMPLSDFLDSYSRGDRDLREWVNDMIIWEASQVDQITPKEKLKTFLQEFEEQEIFHQPTATKWTLFYSYLKLNVLPRVP